MEMFKPGPADGTAIPADEEWDDLKDSIATAAESGDYWPAIFVLLIFYYAWDLGEKEDRPD